MDFLYRAFVEPLEHAYFVKALLGGSIVAAMCGTIGCLVILRRMAFLGDALSHVMIAGIGAGYLVMKLCFGLDAHTPGMLLGALIAAILTVALIGFVSKVSRIKEDTAIGIMYCGIFAAGTVLISVFHQYIHIDLVHFVIGDVLGIGDADLWTSGIAACIVMGTVIIFFRHLQLTSFDPVLAAALGFPVVALDYLLTACVSLVVVSAIGMVGVILVVGLLITPAATAYLLTDRLQRMMVLAACFGISSIVGGLYLGDWINSSGGGAIMVFCTAQFLIVLVLAPRYGLLAGILKRHREVPQQWIEDALKVFLKANRALHFEELQTELAMPLDRIRRAVKRMSRDGLLLQTGQSCALTENGRDQALRIVRAHRLWETYLDQVGLPSEQLHATADQLEHVHDEAAVDYLDHKLGHPLTDPHGSEIPEDFVHIRSGDLVAVSLLREGEHASVEQLAEQADALPLELGDRIRVGARQDEGRTWIVEREGKADLHLNHAQADAVAVKIQKEQNNVEK